MKYSKDEDLKFQVKFLHDHYGFSVPLIAALQGISRATAHYRYESITNEIEVYEEIRARYDEYMADITRCKDFSSGLSLHLNRTPRLAQVALKNINA